MCKHLTGTTPCSLASKYTCSKPWRASRWPGHWCFELLSEHSLTQTAQPHQFVAVNFSGRQSFPAFAVLIDNACGAMSPTGVQNTLPGHACINLCFGNPDWVNSAICLSSSFSIFTTLCWGVVSGKCVRRSENEQRRRRSEPNLLNASIQVKLTWEPLNALQIKKEKSEKLPNGKSDQESCRDSNRGPFAYRANALPTEPQVTVRGEWSSNPT